VHYIIDKALSFVSCGYKVMAGNFIFLGLCRIILWPF